jgi:ATP-dependent Clp protease ATP-binding subunit ClpB
VVFNRLDRSNIRNIVDIRLQDIQKRIQDRKLVLDIDDGVKDWLGRHGYDPVYGARPLNRLIQHKILNPMAKLLLEGALVRKVKVSTGSDDSLVVSRA